MRRQQISSFDFQHSVKMNSMAKISLFLILGFLVAVEAQRRRTPRPPAAAPCPPIPHVQNGAGLLGDGVVNFVCAAGFVLQGTNVITCVNGRWTVAPRCVQQVCPIAPSVPFATFVTGSQGTSATYTCQSGFQINGPSTIFCNTASRSWPQPPVCAPVVSQTCGAPPSIANGLSTVNAAGNVATYSCNAGFSLVGNTQIFCQSFVWTPAAPVCQLNPGVTTPSPATTVCGRPPCGGVTIEPAQTADTSQVGFQVTYTCISGYRIATGPSNPTSSNTITSVQIACQANGQWATAPTCEPKSCGAPPQVPNANPVTTANLNVGDRVEYTCASGYIFAAGSGAIAGNTLVQRTCQIDGTLSGTTPVCQQVQCPGGTFPVNIANANNLVQNNAIPNEVRTVTCLNNYIVSPQAAGGSVNYFSVTCLTTGLWSTVTQSCVYLYPKSCKEYFQRNPGAVSPATVLIDLDGAGLTYSPTQMTCTLTGTTACSSVAPSTPTLTRGTCVVGAGPITGLTGIPPAAIGQTSNTYFVCGSNFQPVSYPATTAFITGLISVSAGTCSQTVTVNCQNGAGAQLVQDNNLFVAIKQNAVSNAVVYNVFDAAIVEVAGTPSGPIRAFNGVCDCAYQVVGTPPPNNPCTGKCKCSSLLNALASDTDIITLPLSAAKPNWVESVLFGEDDNTPGGGAPAAGAFNPSITHTASVGNIQCCEPM